MKYCVLLFSLYVSYSFLQVQAKLEGEAIVGGTDATPGDIKYEISLETEMDNICGGGIIADQYILTAAHCVIDLWNRFKIQSLTVLATALKARAEDDPNAMRIEVEKIYVLDEYNPMNPHPEQFYRTTADFAVLKLKHGLRIKTNPLLSSLNLPESDEHSYVNETAVIAGYGDNWIYIYEDPVTGKKVEFGGGSNGTLRYAESHVIDNEKCAEHFDAPINSTHLCAAIIQRNPKNEEGVCSGDSGSPLVVNGTTVIGILSSSPFGCTEAKSPAVYTRISSYVSFIRDILNDQIATNVRVAVLNSYQTPAGDTVKLYDEVKRN